MTRDEVLEKLRSERAVLDAKIAAVPEERFADPTATGGKSVRDIVAHLTAYEELVVERFRAARAGETTAFDRDRDSWEAFNVRIWAEAAEKSSEQVMDEAIDVFAALLEETARLTDEELNGRTGITEHIDEGWLQERQVWEVLDIDVFGHYPQHYDALDRAAG